MAARNKPLQSAVKVQVQGSCLNLTKPNRHLQAMLVKTNSPKNSKELEPACYILDMKYKSKPFEI